MTIGELARAAGVRISTLRFYERRGLLTPASRSPAGYRRYEAADVDRVLFLRRAPELGFSLAELGAMLALSRRRALRRADAVRAGTEKLAEIDARIADLREMRRAIAGLLGAPCLDPEAPCPIIAALASRARKTSRSRASEIGRLHLQAPRTSRERA